MRHLRGDDSRARARNSRLPWRKRWRRGDLGSRPEPAFAVWQINSFGCGMVCDTRNSREFATECTLNTASCTSRNVRNIRPSCLVVLAREEAQRATREEVESNSIGSAPPRYNWKDWAWCQGRLACVGYQYHADAFRCMADCLGCKRIASPLTLFNGHSGMTRRQTTSQAATNMFSQRSPHGICNPAPRS